MADLIDRAALVEQFRKKQIFEVFPEWEELENSTKIAIIRLQRKFREVILSAPTVDAAPVVRCENCKSGIMSDDNKYIICCRLGVGMELDDFCSHGERRDG